LPPLIRFCAEATGRPLAKMRRMRAGLSSHFLAPDAARETQSYAPPRDNKRS